MNSDEWYQQSVSQSLLSEKLAVIAARLERIVSVQQELVELQREFARTLHPAEFERRDRTILESFLKALERNQEQLERRLTIRWLGATSLFGFIAVALQLLVK